MYFIVLWISYVFYYFLFYVLYCFLISAVWDLHLDQYQAELMIYKAKRGQNYWFTGQNEIVTLPFVLYIKMKNYHFLGHKRSRLLNGGPIFANLVPKYPQDYKGKSDKAAWLKARRFCVRNKICLGGPPSPPPPPPSAVRVKGLIMSSTRCKKKTFDTFDHQ